MSVEISYKIKACLSCTLHYLVSQLGRLYQQPYIASIEALELLPGRAKRATNTLTSFCIGEDYVMPQYTTTPLMTVRSTIMALVNMQLTIGGVKI